MIHDLRVRQEQPHNAPATQGTNGVLQELPAAPEKMLDSLPPSRRGRWLRSGFWSVAAAGLLLGGLWLWASMQFGSLNVALAYLRGERLILNPATVSLGDIRAGERRDVSVQLANYTPDAVVLVGSSTSCGCITMDPLPIRIPPGGTHNLTLNIWGKRQPGSFRQIVQYYTDNADRPVLVVPVTGQAAP